MPHRSTAPARRPLMPLLALSVSGAVLLATGASSVAQAPDRPDVERGAGLFQANCAACHGTVGEGRSGASVTAGPPIHDVEVSYVDLVLRTGRMPIAQPGIGVHNDELDDDEREAVVAYMVDRFDLPGQLPVVEGGDAGRGQERYVRHCAACHGASGDGGISGADVHVPPLPQLEPVAIAEATRVGPFEMPAFEEAVIDDQAVADIAAYLEEVEDTQRSAAGVKELDQIGQALFSAGLALMAAAVIMVVVRVRRLSPDEPGGYHEEPPFEPHVEP